MITFSQADLKWLSFHYILWPLSTGWYTLIEHFSRYLFTLFFRLKSSAAVAYPLKRFDTLCVQRCSSAYHCCNVWLFAFLSASTSLALLLWPLSLTAHFCPQNCCSLDAFWFSHHSLQTLETIVHENPKRFAVSEILTTLSGTNNHSMVKVTYIICISHSDIWSEKQLNLLTTSACFYAFSCCHVIGWLNTCINKLVYRSI